MTSELPLVTIGLPVFNSEKTIKRALDSLLAQTYPNFEIMISDNCSTDKTVEICKTYVERDNRIKLNLNKENLGVIANFRIVHKKAKGKYFMWAGSDDYWEPEFVKTLVNELESDPTAGVAQCAVRRENPDGSLKDIIKFNKNYNTSKLSHWQVTLKLLSPRKEIRLLKYNLFIYGLFKYEAISDTLDAENDVLSSYGERAFLAPVALAHKFRYVDEILFSKTVHTESVSIRYPNDEYKQTSKEMTYLKFYLKYYYKVMVCITKYSKIPLQRKFFVLFFLYAIIWRFASKQKKKVRKALYGKSA
jgi:glycosyltransferase involved in cell wall biosynthesis